MIGRAQPDILAFDQYSSNGDYHLVTHYLLFKIATEILDLPMKHGDFYIIAILVYQRVASVDHSQNAFVLTVFLFLDASSIGDHSQLKIKIPPVITAVHYF